MPGFGQFLPNHAEPALDFPQAFYLMRSFAKRGDGALVYFRRRLIVIARGRNVAERDEQVRLFGMRDETFVKQTPSILRTPAGIKARARNAIDATVPSGNALRTSHQCSAS